MNNTIDLFKELDPILQALPATCFTWFVTPLGTVTVFIGKQTSRKLLDSMHGFAVGVMIDASYWSLLAPAIKISADKEFAPWLPALIGFITGGVFLRIREEISRLKSFWYGQLSGMVEPIAGVIGAAVVIIVQPLLLYALGFVAGAVIFVVIVDVISESQSNGNVDIATMEAMAICINDGT